MILRLISDDHTLLQRFIPVYRPEGKELELLRWKDMTMRVVQLCLRNRIAISYHQNSKNECLPTGCLSRFMFISSSNIVHQSHSCHLKDYFPLVSGSTTNLVFV